MQIPTAPRSSLIAQRALLVIGALMALLMIFDGRRGWLLGASERGDVERSPSARGAAVYVWGGGGYQGGK